MNNYLSTHYIHTNSPKAIIDFSNLLKDHINYYNKKNKKLLILCIGSDRATGDSLGPLVGHKLSSLLAGFENISLLGTLNRPIHALNLSEISRKINKDPNQFTIAIDAALGVDHRVGYISLKKGPLMPGLGVKKSLPMVGDLCITGIVESNSSEAFLALQNTRLNLIMHMADVLSKGIYVALSQLYELQVQYI